jgi:phage recombination protein Bet
MQNVSSFPSPTREQPPVPPIVPDIPKQTILDYLAAIGLESELTEAEKLQFIATCQAFHLNPIKREIHIAVYGEGSSRRVSIITGYETYLKRAERAGKLDGWSSRVEGTGDDMRAIVEIHRKDWSQAFVHEVYWSEAVQKKRDGSPTSFWTKMPKFQLKKVCISQAFRLAFPDDLGGLPYDASELPDAEALAVAPAAPPSSPSMLPLLRIGVAASEAAPLPEASSARDESPPQSEASPSMAAPSAAAPTIRFLGHQDPYPEENREALLKRLDAYLDDNAEAFTEKHIDWIMEKARKSQDREGVLKMLSYAQKVVKNTSAVAGASV